MNNHEKAWVIQRCIDAWTNHYENWPGYCENPMSHDEMMQALKECDDKWLEYEFRGHNTNNQTIKDKKDAYPKPNYNSTNIVSFPS